MTIQAIETHYKGYRFRSRLEARWAVFFDALQTDWEWRYETEGYDMYGARYLPDFELLSTPRRNGYGEVVQHSAFIEVKGKVLTPEEWNKAVMFSAYLKHDIYIFQGEIGLDVNISWISAMYDDMPRYLLDTKAIPPFMCSSEMFWMQCSNCGIADLQFLVIPDVPDVNQGCHFCEGGKVELETNDLHRAIEIARSARFEHGETPKVGRGRPRLHTR